MSVRTVLTGRARPECARTPRSPFPTHLLPPPPLSHRRRHQRRHPRPPRALERIRQLLPVTHQLRARLEEHLGVSQGHPGGAGGAEAQQVRQAEQRRLELRMGGRSRESKERREGERCEMQ